MATAGRQKRALTTFQVAGEVFGSKPMEQLEDPSRPSAAYYLLRALRTGLTSSQKKNGVISDANGHADPAWTFTEEESNDASED